MDIKKIIEENTVLSILSIVISSFLAGVGCMTFLNNKEEAIYDKVPKNTYTLNKDINEKYVSLEKYNIVSVENKKLKDGAKIIEKIRDTVSIPMPYRKIEIFKNDTIDYYGIAALQSNIFSDLVKTRNHLKNNGFQNTEIFKSNENKLFVICYGYACYGKGLNKANGKVNKLIKQIGLKKSEIIDLTTIAPKGFVEHIERSIFAYYKAKQ